jgi:polyphosphate kinase
VELIAPIYDSKLKDKLWEFIDIMLQDNRLAWLLNEDGSYTQIVPQVGEDEKNTHTILMNKTPQREKALS